jgi:hypothetical protein
VRRRLAGILAGAPYLAAQGTNSRARGLYAQLGSTRARLGGQGVAWASPAAGTVRGRRGHSGELGEAMLCVKRRGIGQGIMLTAHRG